jgi:hypothetical protein
MAFLVDSTGEVSRSGSMSGSSGDKRKGERGSLDSGWSNAHHAKHHRQYVGVSPWLGAIANSTLVVLALTEIDEIGLNETVPEEAVICAFPHGNVGRSLRLSLEVVCEVERVGEVHRSSSQEVLDQREVGIFVGVMQWAFSHRKKFCSCDFVDHVAAQSAHRLCFGDDNDVFVCPRQRKLRLDEIALTELQFENS